MRKGMSDKAESEMSEGAVSHLPCRGCLPDCKDRAVCDGRPWRSLGREVVEQASTAQRQSA